MTSTEVDTMDAGSLRAAYKVLMNEHQHLAASYESLVRQQAPAEHAKCKCSMAISALGDGCRYCQPQEYIDRLHDMIEGERAEQAAPQPEQSETLATAHDWIRSALTLPDDAPRRFDYYAQRIVERDARIAELEQALDEIANPVKYMRMRLEDGEQLSGMAAMQLGQSASYLRDIARAALAKHGEAGE